MTVERMLVKMTHAIYYLEATYAKRDHEQCLQWLDADAHAARRILYGSWTHKAGRHACKHCPAGSRGRYLAEGRAR